jgi:hypothetical protein
MYRLPLGITMEGDNATLGFALTFLGVIALFFHPFSGVLIIPGLIVFAQIKVLEFDIQNKKFRKATNYLLFKTGKWQDADSIHKLYIGYENLVVSGNIKLLKPTTQFRYFPVSIIDEDGKEIMHLKSFTDYIEAKKLYTELMTELGVAGESKYEELQKSAESRRVERN